MIIRVKSSRSSEREMPTMRYRSAAGVLVVLAISAGSVNAEPPQQADAGKKPPTVINPPPTAKDWADLAKLPDWSGVWNPKITDQDAQVRNNPPPWNENTAKKIERMVAE